MHSPPYSWRRLQFVAVLCIICSLQHSFGFVKTSVIRLKHSFSYDLDRSVRHNEIVSAATSGDGTEPTKTVMDQKTEPTKTVMDQKTERTKSVMDQKNDIIFDRFGVNGNRTDLNLTQVAEDHVNFCDESFNVFLNKKIEDIPLEKDKQYLGRVRYEINCARQRKLRGADIMLRGMLSAGGKPQMEALLAYHLRRAEIDMAFMVILQMNIEDATNSGAHKAATVMSDLNTVIQQHQDSIVNAPVRLLRMLVRNSDQMIRKQMLRQKLLIGDNLIKETKSEIANLLEEKTTPDTDAGVQPQSTTVPQCEHIVVAAVQNWGGADVTVAELEDAIADILSQVMTCGTIGSTMLDGEVDLETLCTQIRTEIGEVLVELETPKVSDQCD
jgi:hypothetical protein